MYKFRHNATCQGLQKKIEKQFGNCFSHSGTEKRILDYLTLETLLLFLSLKYGADLGRSRFGFCLQKIDGPAIGFFTAVLFLISTSVH